MRRGLKKSTITLAAGMLLAATAASTAAAVTSTPTTPGSTSATTAGQSAGSAKTFDAQRWASVWARRMRANERHARKHARLLSIRLPASLRQAVKRPVEPGAARAVTELDWKAYGEQCKAQALKLGRYVRVTWRRISHPRSYNSAAVWTPLLRHEGWPKSQIPTALHVIWRESNANPRVVGPGPFYGLFQIWSAFNTGHWDLLNPVVNVRLALQLYHRQGWQPWSATAY